MLPDYDSHEYDVLLIGGGLASSQTLRGLLEEWIQTPPPRPQRIAMLEQGPDFFGGVAYGARSAPTAKVITPLAEFLDDAERGDFIDWIRSNADQLLDELIELDRVHTTEWARALRSPNTDWASQYVPRCWYGRFLTEQMTTIIEAADQAGVASVDLIHTTVERIERIDDRFVVNQSLTAKKIVLGIGSVGGGDRMYREGMQATIDRVAKQLPELITIVGANATMLDLLYQLEDDPRIAAAKPNYRVVSRRGILPALHEGALPVDAALPHLDALQEARGLRACVIEQAVRAELERSRGEGGRLIPAVSARLGPLLDLLPPDEKAIFANHTGVEIGRLQRRVGGDYAAVLDDLIDAGRLEHVQDTVERLDGDVAGEGDGATVLDAAGFGAMEPGQHALIDSLMHHRLAEPTTCCRGLTVDDSLEATPGLYVIGPMLAGNVLNDRPVWHLEHAGRIISMARELGHRLGQSASSPTGGSTLSGQGRRS